MNTIKIMDRKQTKIIAHRGVSGLEKENTNSAFVAAGNRSYFGIETDVHKTLDNRYVIIHDDSTARVAIDNLIVEQSTYQTLRGLLLTQIDGVKQRSDVRIPNLEEYIGICRHYEKTAVLELKNHFNPEEIHEIYAITARLCDISKVIFISFDLDNLISLRQKYPQQPAQYLTGEFNDDLIGTLLTHQLDLDIYWEALTAERIADCHRNGIKVNCWTVDSPEDAQRLINSGVDYITTNILE